MTLRTKFSLYLVLLHIVLGGMAILVVVENRQLLILIEVLFVVSVVIGAILVRAFFHHLNVLQTGIDFMSERDFSSHFRPVGHPEIDRLIEVYNRMIEQLREERLKQQEQQFFLEKVLSASPAGILSCDFDGRIGQLNPSAERLFSISSGELVGRQLNELDHGLAAALAALTVGESRVITYGGRRRVKVWRSEFFDRGFSRSFFILEELTEELRALEKAAYEKLIRMMSHEVNNSVGAVSSLLDSCLNYAEQIRPQDREDFRNALAVAISRSANLNTFMNGFADVVRLPPPSPASHDLLALIRDIMVLLKPELDQRRIKHSFESDEHFPPVRFDKNQIEQVVLNVLKNAIESVGEDGTIVIECRRQDNEPVLVVHDSGPGIPDDLQSEIFTPFFSTKRDGRGLGLTVVQEILSQHRFNFQLGRSERLGGAEFRIQM